MFLTFLPNLTASSAVWVVCIIFKLPFKILRLFGLLTKTTEKINRLIESLEVDPSETFNSLNWEPPYTTKEGIEITIDWFTNSKNLSLYKSDYVIWNNNYFLFIR